MALGTPKTLASVAYLTGSAANIFAPAASTIYGLMTQISLCNTDTAIRYVTLYIGATGGSTGGTEILKLFAVYPGQTIVPPGCSWSPGRVMKSTDFLTGFCDTANKVTIEVTGYQAVVP